MSLVLAFDTATQATVVGLLAAGQAPIERRDDPEPGVRPRHTQRLLALCEAALAEAGAAWEDVDRIGVGVGPGSFTGLRIGVATARALGQARGVETVTVSTLAALARGVAGDAAAARDVLAVLDARRGEAFAAAFAAGDAASPTAVSVDPPALAGLARPGSLAVGDGAVRYRGDLEAGGIEVPPDDDLRHRVGGAPLVRLAAAATPVPVGTLVPDYVRLPDAEIHHRRVAAGP
jgi:tRNA threonylcarbamoyladenosine biosynthesis protein TsaB